MLETPFSWAGDADNEAIFITSGLAPQRDVIFALTHQAIGSARRQSKLPSIDAGGPSEDLLHPRSWSKYLRTHHPGRFDHCIVNASFLMHSLELGRERMHQTFVRHKLGIVKPNIAIREGLLPFNAYCALSGKQILVSYESIIEFALLNLTDIVSCSRSGTVTFEGYTTDLWELIGVEETHHAAFLQTKKIQEYNATLSVSEYDAQEVEYRALLWQLHYAKLYRMPSFTIEVLQQRINAARKMRGRTIPCSTGITL